MGRKSYIQGVLMSFILFDVCCVHSENVATGTNYTFPPKIQGKIEYFDWKHKGDLLVDWELGNVPQWYRYRDQARINTDTGDLILQVKKEDSGVFKGQFIVKGVLQYFERTITVIDPVSEPKVTCEQNDKDITVLCSVDPPVQAEFTWTGPNGFSHVGKSVHITRKERDDSVYYCTAKNEVSQKTIEFTLKDCTRDPVSEPKVTCEQNDTDITLLCSVDPPVQAEFTWTGPNGFSHVGKSVHITRKERDDSVYYCTAKNEVSQKTIEFTLKDCTRGCVHSENVAAGTDYTFPPKIPGKMEYFDWKHKGDLVVDWELGNVPTWYRYEKRASINTDTGELTLQVKKEDSGVFKGQFQLKGVLHYFECTITVIDPVSKPKVTCEQNDKDITVLCSVDPPVQAEFTWTGPNGFSHVGKSVHITRKERDDSVYYCTAKNEVSQKTIEFTLKDCTRGLTTEHKAYITTLF